MKKLLLIALGLIVFGSTAFAEPLSLEKCMKKSMQEYSMLKAAKKQVEVHENENKSLRGRFLPLVKLDFNVLYWEDEHKIIMDIIPPSLITDFGAFMSDETKAGFAKMSEDGLKARDQLTYQTKVTIAQPLMQLYKIYFGYDATDKMAEKSQMDLKVAERQVQLKIAEIYFGLISALEGMETIKAAIKTIEATEKVVQDFRDAGVVEKNALLKVQVQKADMQKKLFMAEKGAKLATAGLNMFMGRELNTPIEPVDYSGSGFGKVKNNAKPQILQNRPEYQAAKLQEETAKSGKHVAIGEMLPDINAVFQYENNQGVGVLSKENQYFVGVVLSWNVWEWGATFYNVYKADARYEQAKAVKKAKRDEVLLDVQTKRLNLEEAMKSLEVARATVLQARENLRVEQERFNVQETTTTDLLAAQTMALKAENEKIVSQMKAYEADLALKIAQGEDLAN